MILESNRTFKLWLSHVSHNRVLIRSPKSEEYDTNYDLMFFGIDFLSIPTLFRGVRIYEADEYYRSQCAIAIGKRLLSDTKIYVLETQGNKFFVACVTMKMEENSLDIFETRFDQE